MSSAWCLHERTKLGGDGGQWALSRDGEFTVGRSPDSNIKSHSQSVESKHAVFSWDPKTLAFTLRDLGTINGTYVNNRPLRGSSVVLKHNDSIRFGYDKDRVFRMEECFSSPRPSPGSMPAAQSQTRVPVSGHPHSLPPPDSNSNSNSAPDDPPVSTGGASPDHTPHPAPTTVESTPHSHTPIPTIQHALPTSSTEEELTGSLNSQQRCDGRRSVDLEQSPARNKGSKLYGQPDWWGEEAGQRGEGAAEARDREFEFAKRPGSQILRQLDPYHTSSSYSEGKKESAPKLSARDELRLQSLASPDPATSWVIDFGGGASGGGGGSGGTLPRVRRARDRTSRPRSADPSPNRLMAARRDHSPLPTRPITPTSSSSSSSSTTSRSASFSIPIAAGRRGQRATTPPLVRAADTASKKSPHTDRVISPKRKTPKKPNPLVSTSLPSSPQHSKPPSPRKLKPQSPQRSKPPQASRGPQSKSRNNSLSKPETPKSERPPQDLETSPRSRTISPPNIKTAPGDLPRISSKVSEAGEAIELKHLKEGGRMSHLVKDDETYTAMPVVSSDECSSLSDHTLSPPSERPTVVVAATTSSDVGSGEGGVAGKGEGLANSRKQWASDGSESPDSLMIANIEARMRRLSKLAHQTARQVSALKGRLQEGCRMEVRGVDYLSLRDSSPVVTRAEQHLPEWKSFNKEAHSIFRNMRVVEKWLHDIDGTLSSIKPVDDVGSSAEGRDTPTEVPATGEAEEGVDLASDGELYLDTVETTSNSEISD